MISRRSFLTGLIAAPIVVRAGICMPIRPLSKDGPMIDQLYHAATSMTRGAIRPIIHDGESVYLLSINTKSEYTQWIMGDDFYG